MENKEEKKSIRKNIEEKIKKDETRIRPKSYFTVRNTLLIISAVILFALGVFIVSYIIFSLQKSGLWFVPKLGSLGFGLFFRNFPWFLGFLGIIFATLFGVIIWQKSEAYKKPIIFSILFISLLVLAFSFLIQTGPMHQNIFREVEKGRFPGVRSLYGKNRIEKVDKIYIGTISELKDFGFVMEKKDETKIEVIVSKNTKFPQGNNFEVNDYVLIVGDQENAKIEAEGVILYKASGEDPPPFFLFKEKNCCIKVFIEKDLSIIKYFKN